MSPRGGVRGGDAPLGPPPGPFTQRFPVTGGNPDQQSSRGDGDSRTSRHFLGQSPFPWGWRPPVWKLPEAARLGGCVRTEWGLTGRKAAALPPADRQEDGREQPQRKGTWLVTGEGASWGQEQGLGRGACTDRQAC